MIPIARIWRALGTWGMTLTVNLILMAALGMSFIFSILICIVAVTPTILLLDYLSDREVIDVE